MKTLRLGVALFLAHRYTRDPNIARILPLLPLSDLLGFSLYLGSYCGTRIVWRGERFRLLAGGKLQRHAFGLHQGDILLDQLRLRFGQDTAHVVARQR